MEYYLLTSVSMKYLSFLLVEVFNSEAKSSKPTEHKGTGSRNKHYVGESLRVTLSNVTLASTPYILDT